MAGHDPVSKHFIHFTLVGKEKGNQVAIILGGWCHLLAEGGSSLK